LGWHSHFEEHLLRRSRSATITHFESLRSFETQAANMLLDHFQRNLVLVHQLVDSIILAVWTSIGLEGESCEKVGTKSFMPRSLFDWICTWFL